VGQLKKYSIAFSGLSLGKHEFSFDIDSKFFELIENPEFAGTVGEAFVTLTKQSTMLVLDFHIKVNVPQTCDRCLAEAPIKLESENQLIVKFGEQEDNDNDEILVLPHTESEVNIAQYLYEYVFIMIPLQKVLCELNNDMSICDQEVLSKISQHKVNTQPESAQDDVDPRWQQLKNIKLN
jgi:uncharacterized protein